MNFEEILDHLRISKYLNVMLEHGTLDYRTFSGDWKWNFYHKYD